jgi:hypothetical protein
VFARVASGRRSAAKVNLTRRQSQLEIAEPKRNGLKPLATLDLGGTSYVFYVGLGALILNVAVAVIVTVILNLVSPRSIARS